MRRSGVAGLFTAEMGLTAREGDRTVVYLNDKQLSDFSDVLCGFLTCSVGAFVFRCASPAVVGYSYSEGACARKDRSGLRQRVLVLPVVEVSLDVGSRRLKGACPHWRKSDLMVERTGIDVIDFLLPLTREGLSGVFLFCSTFGNALLIFHL